MQSYVLLVPACVSACALRENVIIIWRLSIRSWVRKYLDSECTQFLPLYIIISTYSEVVRR